MAKLTDKIMSAIKGAAYIEAPLQDYHTAQAVKAALRRRDPMARLSGVREALNRYRVSAWLRDGRIVLMLHGADIATF